MIELVITHTAENDLIELWAHVAQESYPEYADNLIDKLVFHFQLLVSQPEMGVLRENLGEGVRLFPVDKINIIYWLKGSTLEVLRVHNSALDSLRLYIER